MDDSEKFNETSLPKKKKIFTVTDADYTHAERVCKDLEVKNVREYHDLYVESNTLLFVDIFEDF